MMILDCPESVDLVLQELGSDACFRQSLAYTEARERYGEVVEWMGTAIPGDLPCHVTAVPMCAVDFGTCNG